MRAKTPFTKTYYFLWESLIAGTVILLLWLTVIYNCYRKKFRHNRTGLKQYDGSQHAFPEITRRIAAISLIHQKLFQVKNTGTINMQEYTRELIQYLKESELSQHPVRFDVAVDAIELKASQSVSVGLILHEAITNSIKYAFEEEVNNTISISMKKN